MFADRNPFEPDVDGPPLRLTFDSKSLSSLRGLERTDADFLISLSHTPQVDGLVAWQLRGFAEDVRACFTRPTRGLPDDLTVSLADDPHGFIGGVRMSGQWARMAEEYGLVGPKQDWLIHYGQVTTFHHSAGRHLFVTADVNLLQGRDNGPFKNIWRSHGVVSVRQALALVGALMRIHGRIYDAAKPGNLHYLTNYTVLFHLAAAALPNRLRLVKRFLETNEGLRQEAELQRFQQSLLDRTMDLLRARAYAQRENLRRQHNHATVDEILYHHRTAVAALAAAYDSLAQLSSRILHIPDSELPDRQMIGFGIREFRRLLSQHNGATLADRSSAAAPLFTVLKRFRDPVIHSAGLAGSTLLHVGTPYFSEARAEITREQREALDGLGKRSSRPERWGLRAWGERASLDPVAFVGALATEGVALLDTLLGALCDDLGIPAEPVELLTSEETLRRLRLLAGLAV